MGHAKQHSTLTHHRFCLQLSSGRIWNYDRDVFVHRRLVQHTSLPTSRNKYFVVPLPHPVDLEFDATGVASRLSLGGKPESSLNTPLKVINACTLPQLPLRRTNGNNRLCTTGSTTDKYSPTNTIHVERHSKKLARERAAINSSLQYQQSFLEIRLEELELQVVSDLDFLQQALQQMQNRKVELERNVSASAKMKIGLEKRTHAQKVSHRKLEEKVNALKDVTRSLIEVSKTEKSTTKKDSPAEKREECIDKIISSLQNELAVLYQSL